MERYIVEVNTVPSFYNEANMVELSIETSCLVEQWKNAAGEFHRLDGPAINVRSAASGKTLAWIWYRNGVRHRDDGVAVWGKWDDQELSAHYCDGKLHRDRNRPAFSRIDTTTNIVWGEDYYKEGQLHREGGPAFIRRDDLTGVTHIERWMQNGLSHRIGGPSDLFISEKTNVILEEFWCRNGEGFRTNGPIEIFRDEDTGEVVEQNFSSTPFPKRSEQGPALG